MDKTLADVVNLKKLIIDVLQQYNGHDFTNPDIQESVADTICERYRNLIKEIATKFLEREASKNSAISTFQEIMRKKN